MNRSEQAILRTATRRPAGTTVWCPNARLTTRQAMKALQARGLVIYEVRDGWAGNWLTAAGEQEADLEDNSLKCPKCGATGENIALSADKTDAHCFWCDAYFKPAAGAK